MRPLFTGCSPMVQASAPALSVVRPTGYAK